MSACDSLFGPDPRRASSLAAAGGQAQTGVVGQPLGAPLGVTVLDQDARPLPGQVVRWSVVEGGGKVAADSTVTDAAGVARVVFTLGPTAGEHAAAAAIDGLGTVRFEATALPATPAEIAADVDTVTFSAIGDTLRLSAEVRDAFGNVVREAAVTWSSSDADVIAVTQRGVLLSRSAGRAVLTGVAGAARATLPGIVEQRPATLEVSPQLDTLTALGGSIALEATTRDPNGFQILDAAVRYTASDTAVVAVDAAGRVTAMSPGQTTVRAAVGGLEAEATIVVAPRVARVVLGTEPDTLRALGATVRLEAAAVDANGHEVSGAIVAWTSLDEDVATIDSAGVATGRGRGSARIVASAAGVADTVSLDVVPWGRITISMELDRWEIYDVVFPIMQRYGLTGNIAVVTDWVGDEDRLTLPQIREMHAAGWAVVPHSKTLPRLPELSDSEMRDEVLGSRDWVRDRGFRGASIFIVPNHKAGDRERALIRQTFAAARAHGYEAVHTMVPWPPEEQRFEITAMQGENYLETADARETLRATWLRAIHEGRLLEIFFHRVRTGQAADFEAVIEQLAEYGEYVRTYAELFE